MNNFDVIIPVGEKDVSFVPKVVDHLNRCINGIERIYIITAEQNIRKLEHRVNNVICTLVDENKLLPELTFSAVQQRLYELSPMKKGGTGWYFQQLLKFAFAKSEYCKEYYLSWDADTLALAPIRFFDNEHILFNPKQEYNPNYFKTINRLFGFGKVCDFSFVAENMMFSKKIVCELLEKIENCDVCGKTWVDKILYACDFSDIMPAFSEFETYGTFCNVNYPKLYKQRHLNTFRGAGLICGRHISENKLQIMSFDLDIASFEIQHEPMFPYNIPNKILQYKLLLKKIKKMSLSEVIKKIKCKLQHYSENECKIEDNIYRLPKQIK